MEKFTFTDRKISNRKLNTAVEILIALFMSSAFVMCLGEICGVAWSFSNAFSGSLTGGLVNCYNSLARNLAASDGIMMKALRGASDGCGLFLSVLTIVSAAACYLIIKSGRKSLLALGPVVVTIAAVFFHLDIGIGSVLFMAVSLAAAWFYMEGGIRNFGPAVIFILVIAALTAGAFRIPAVSDFTQNSGAISSVREKTAEFAADIYYGNNPLKSGDLSQRTREKSDEVALEITMDDPHSMYLRGFIGEKFAEAKWQTLPNTSYYDFLDEAYWIEDAGLNMEGQSGQARDLVLGEKSKAEDVKIKAIKADKRYGYIPYEINSSIEDARHMGGSFVVPEKFERMKKYSYTALENPAKDWTEAASKLFTAKQDDDVQKYLVAESYYNEHVYEKYTFLSNSERVLLKKNFGPSKASLKAHADYKTAIADIKGYLKDNFIYTEDLGERDENKPFLETFFMEKKGYDAQYASAAALMFRYYGIPARYVEGYLVTPEDAEKMKSGEPYEISKERNHAWVEIYVDGIGFVPIEVCPEYEGVMEEADMSVGISNDALKSSFEESGSSQSNVLESGGADKKHESIDILLLIFIIFACLLVIALIYAATKKVAEIIKEKRKKRYLYYKADPKTAVGAILGFMEEEDLPVSDRVRSLGNLAAYSRESIDEETRSEMLGCLKQARKEKRRSDRIEKKKKRTDKRNAYASSHRFTALFMRGGKSRRKSR